jgi:glycerol-3-phosphate dehydrogenase
MLVNAGGPWVEDIIRQTPETMEGASGSRKPYRQQTIRPRQALFLPRHRRYASSAIPYEQDFTPIGTDEEHSDVSKTRL